MGVKTIKSATELASANFCMNPEIIDISKTDIEDGWEWFVFKKRSQRARKKRLRECGKSDKPPNGAPKTFWAGQRVG